jgi:hypothetical protein
MDDVEAIRRLKARYFRTMDTKDWAGMRQVFTDDVVIDTSEADDIVIWPNGMRLDGYGHYTETYERAAGGWRIKTSKLTRLHMDFATPAES